MLLFCHGRSAPVAVIGSVGNWRRPSRVDAKVVRQQRAMGRIDLPLDLRGVFFDWLWDTSKVWQLPTSSTLMPIEDLVWHLDLTVWTTVRGEPRFDLAPSTVLAAPALHSRHWDKIERADVTYPLELFGNGGRWVILDGYHRLCRHWLIDSRVVPVRLHPDACRDRIVRR